LNPGNVRYRDRRPITARQLPWKRALDFCSNRAELIEPALFDTDTDCAGVALIRRALLLLRRKIHLRIFIWLAASSGHVGYLVISESALQSRFVSIEMIGKIMGGRSGGRPKGAKNTSTLWREAQEQIGNGTLVVDVADPLEVIEQVMRYFYGLGVQGAKSKAPIEQVQKCFNRALHAASIAAPYRHPRLSAVKHIDHQGNTIDGISANASVEELRAEIAKRVAMLVDKGYVDLAALPLPAPTNGKGATPDAEGDEEDRQEGSD
jgi:hypothetical protein